MVDDPNKEAQVRLTQNCAVAMLSDDDSENRTPTGKIGIRGPSFRINNSSCEALLVLCGNEVEDALR
jgi:hypothetical protein